MRMLTEEQAYAAVFYFLEQFWSRAEVASEVQRAGYILCVQPSGSHKARRFSRCCADILSTTSPSASDKLGMVGAAESAIR